MEASLSALRMPCANLLPSVLVSLNPIRGCRNFVNLMCMLRLHRLSYLLAIVHVLIICLPRLALLPKAGPALTETVVGYWQGDLVVSSVPDELELHMCGTIEVPLSLSPLLEVPLLELVGVFVVFKLTS